MCDYVFKDEKEEIVGIYPGNYKATYPLKIYDISGNESILKTMLEVSISAVLIDKVLTEDNTLEWLWGIGLKYLHENQPKSPKKIVIKEKDIEEGELITPFEEIEEEIEEEEI